MTKPSTDRMNNDIPSQQILPDYISKENWDAFVARLPDTDRLQAPSYSQRCEDLKKQEAAFLKVGCTVHWVEIDVAGMERWIEEHHKAFTRDSAGQYAMHKYVEQSTGRPHVAIDPCDRI